MQAVQVYVALVVSRHFRALIFLLVAAQVFLSAPVVAGMTSAPGTASMPCDDFMPAASDGEPCPCCPDGIDSAAACLSACAAFLGAISTPALPRVITTSTKAVATVTVSLACAAEPPLKPPPIR